MIHASSEINIGNLERFAFDTAVALRTIPERFTNGGDLLEQLIEPMRVEARDRFGCWMCRIMPSHCLGCGIDGRSELLVGEESGTFTGVFHDISIVKASVDPLLAGDLADAQMPALVFETVDGDTQTGIAQLYVHVAVPLVGTLVDIERICLAA